MSAHPSKWPALCTLMGCTKPALRPHHHHFYIGHLVIAACQCSRVDQPGTSSSQEAQK